MNNINKNQIIIGIVAISMIIIVIIYIFVQKEQNTTNFNELEISENMQEMPKEQEDNKIKVHIAGSVVEEGIIELPEGARVADAIKEAGGTTADANMKQINLAYKLQDGQKIYIPNQNETEEDIRENMGEVFVEETSLNNKTGKININTATQTEFELLSGIGPSTATKIINYRKENGNFQSIEEIKNVPGIGEAKYSSIAEEITI